MRGHVAHTKKYKIPLSCFNKRFCYLHHSADHSSEEAHCSSSQDAHSANSSPEQDLPRQQKELHHPDKTNGAIEVIPGPEQHITEAFLNARYGDDESIVIRGALRSLELMVLGEFKSRANLQDALNMINSMSSGVDEEPHVVVPHPKNQLE